MRLLLPLLLLLSLLALTAASPLRVPSKTRTVGASNALALQHKLALPRPASIPPRCSRSNATCMAGARRRHSKRQAPHPSTTVLPLPRTNGYQNTCTGVRMTQTVNPLLSATCTMHTTEKAYTEFRLAECITYSVIGLSCHWKPLNQDFANKCTDCKLVGTKLDCLCGLLRNQIDLAECVGNENGRLACRPHLGL